MFKSMTGYGSSSVDTKNGSYVVEIQSVNRRFLESTVYLPKEFSSLEMDIRKIISKKIFRGQVVCKLNFYPSEENILELLPNVSFLKKLKKGWEDIAKELKIKDPLIGVDFLSQQLQLKAFPKSELAENLLADTKEIMKCVDQALGKLISMKEQEGQSLAKDIKKRLKLVEGQVLKIEELSKDSCKGFEEKLKERLAAFLPNSDIDERILKEIALYADKVDITEEIVRLKSHFEQFNPLITKKEDAIGRKIDFLLQEMTREINTISAKVSFKQASIYIVDIKSELEKIREQAQNIE